MAEAIRAIIVGLALTIAISLFPATGHSQTIRKGPNWSELSTQERQILAPLASDWDKWDLLRKNKWLVIAKRYPTLPAPEQQRIRERMQGWAKLSSQERQAAREKFKGLKQLPPEKRNELGKKWIEYQSLPPEQRQELRRASATPRSTPGSDQTKTSAPPPTSSPPPSPAVR